MSLANHEQESIINWNKDEKIAYIFTYESTWINHLEKKLGLKPVWVNSYGGKEYIIDKSRISMPRAKKKISKAHLAKLHAGKNKALASHTSQ